MTSKKAHYLSALIIFASVIYQLIIYGKLPVTVASHWDAVGNVNGYLPRFWAVALAIIIPIILGLIFAVIPKIDPLKGNHTAFEREYNWLRVGMLLMFALIFAYTNSRSLPGMDSHLVTVTPIMVMVGLLFFWIGWILPRTRRNYFVGIRTPWTLDSDQVWKETHAKSGPVFMAVGILTVFGGLIGGNFSVVVTLSAIIAAALYSVILSYVLHVQLESK
jgi:uncharacterized membrane protein